MRVHRKGVSRVVMRCLLTVVLCTLLTTAALASGQGYSPCVALETVDLYAQPDAGGEPLYQVGPGTALMVREVIHDDTTGTDWSVLLLENGTAYALTSKLRALDTLSSVQPSAQEAADLTAPEEHQVTETPYKVSIALKKEVKPADAQRAAPSQVRQLVMQTPQSSETPEPISAKRSGTAQLRDASKTDTAEQAEENVSAFFVTSTASLYAKASTDAETLLTIEQGTIVLAGEAVTDAQGDTWLPVLLDVGEGWVLAEHLQAMSFFVGDASGVTPAASANASQTPAQTATATATATAAATATAKATATATPTPAPSPLATATTALPSGDEQADESATQASLATLEVVPLGNSDGDVFLAGNKLSPYYHDFFFPYGRTMQGIFSTLGMYVTMPDYSLVENATLLVSYTCSDLILESVSSLTFYMNDIPFYSCPIRNNGSRETVFYVDVPIDLMNHTAANLLEIRGYVRLTDDEGCTDEYNGANWLTFSEATSLRIGFDLVDDENMLSYYPYPFMSVLDTTGKNLSVTTSDSVDDKELEAALLVMGGLGSVVEDENEITLTRYGNAGNDKLIYFGLRENTPAALLSLLGREIPADSAVIKRVEDGDKELLLVIADNGEALVEAARLLVDDSRVMQIQADEHVISVGETAIIMQNAQLSDLIVEGQWSFKDFVGGLRFNGPFHQEATFNLPVSSDYVLGADGKFVIRFRYSENLDYDRSLVTVYWGTVPLGSKKLTREGAEGDSLTLTVPADLVGISASTMTIAFELEIKDLECTPRQINMPWAYVSEDSTAYLPLGSTSELNLSYLPAPFQRDGRLNNVMVVVSDNPGAQELLTLGRVMSMIGNGADAYGTLVVRKASEFDAADADYNIIAVGEPLQNTFLQGINDDLFFQYADDFTRFMSNSKMVLSEAYASRIGTIQLLASPYASSRAMLAVTATSDEGMKLLVRTLGNAAARQALAHDTAVIDPGNTVSTFQSYHAVTSEGESKPTIIDTITSQREPLVFTLIATSAMLILLLAVIMVLIRLRSRKK